MMKKRVKMKKTIMKKLKERV